MFLCSLCSKTFPRPSKLANHVVSHTKEKPHKCLTCSAAFGTLGYLKTHIRAVHKGVKVKAGEKKLQCSMCSYKCSTKQYLQIHVRKHSSERPFSCSLPGCGFNTKYKASLAIHIRGFHNHERPAECAWTGCNYKGKNAGSLKCHLKVHSNEKQFVCDWSGCNFACKVKSALDRHVFLVHNDDKPLRCSSCDFRTKYKSRLQQHQDEHKSIKRFHCKVPKCSFAAHRNQHLKSHFDSKHRNKDVACTTPGCNFKCGSVALLKRHDVQVHALPIFKCSSPSCRFSTRSPKYLLLHVSSRHEGEQSVKAEQSDMEQADKVDKLTCPFPKCGYQTDFQHRYDFHVQTHDEGNRKHVCKFCSFRFRAPADLQRHILKHVGERPYNCSLCGYSALDELYLNFHARRIHNIYAIPRTKGNQHVWKCRTCCRNFGSNSEIVLHSMSHLQPVVALQRLSLILV